FFGESGTGPGSDLAHATRIAAQMVGAFGMAGSLVSFEAIEAGPITQAIVGKVLANEDARAAVERLLDQAKADVHSLLDNNRHLVVALRDELLLNEELVGDEIVDVIHVAEERRRLGGSTGPGSRGSRGVKSREVRPGAAGSLTLGCPARSPHRMRLSTRAPWFAPS